MLLKDQVALVTGAGRGWGQSIALAYTRQGAKVVAASRTQSEIDNTVAMIQAEGGQAVGFTLDVSSEDSCRRAMDFILEKYGRLDVLVNNAAQLPVKPFADFTIDEFTRVLRVNLVGALMLTSLALPVMKRQGGGSIINVSSNAGVRPFENESIYCASKYALEGFTKSLALEVRGDNIAVNTITPGGLLAGVRIKPTSLTQAEYDALPPEEKAKWVDSIVMTEAFVFLARQRGGGVTGERILAYEMSERIRKEGWDLVYERMDDPAAHWEAQR
ncbi:MAG TPA: SDR family oxidoreductase [Chloroflexi bacterium]|nr:SDR family oxidoreductase [Chloroflexota bacterium]